jgi:hypothetical protein
MPTIEYPQTAKHVIAHNNDDVFHYSIVEPQNCFATGQPYMEIFDSEEEAKQNFPQAFNTIDEV